MPLHRLTFNPFRENTYVLADAAGRAVVIDPGMSDQPEREEFDALIRKHDLTLEACWLTHAHLDHVLGIPHVHAAYGLTPKVHPLERELYSSGPQRAAQFGLALASLPEADYGLSADAPAVLGELSCRVLFAPGHSPGSVCFYLAEADLLVGGDVLFRESIGRTDLPGGHHETLLTSIREQVYTLPKATVVHAGHGPETTVAYERVNNPFVRA